MNTVEFFQLFILLWLVERVVWERPRFKIKLWTFCQVVNSSGKFYKYLFLDIMIQENKEWKFFKRLYQHKY